MRTEVITTARTIKLMKPNKLSRMRADIFLYLLLLPAILSVLVFKYIPIPGLIIAFKDYSLIDATNALTAMFTSKWVGLQNIREVFTTAGMVTAIFNTLKLSLITLALSFPIPVTLAVLFTELKVGIFKKIAQTVSYLPHFLSVVSIIGIVITFYGLYGPINDLRVAMLGEGVNGSNRILFLSQPGFFIPNVVIITIWKEAGWGSILYLANIAGIDPQLYEAARMDGAGRFRQVLNITLPSLIPTIVITLILSIGSIFSFSFDLVFGLQNAFVRYETIDTLVYKMGILSGNYSLAAALGFTRGIVAFILTVIVNYFSKKATDVGLF